MEKKSLKNKTKLWLPDSNKIHKRFQINKITLCICTYFWVTIYYMYPGEKLRYRPVDKQDSTRKSLCLYLYLKKKNYFIPLFICLFFFHIFVKTSKIIYIHDCVEKIKIEKCNYEKNILIDKRNTDTAKAISKNMYKFNFLCNLSTQDTDRHLKNPQKYDKKSCDFPYKYFIYILFSSLNNRIIIKSFI